MFRYIKAFLIFIGISSCTQSYGQTLIINEVSNGPTGNQEYVEFVVVDNAVTYDCNSPVPPCIDIRGWIFDDNSGYHGAVGVAAGCIRFADDPLWACVPLGTIIVIYNNGDPNTSMPAADVTMADGNCTIVAPVNSTLFDSNPTTPGAIACSYPAAGWVPGGNWNNTLLANGGDCARIVDLSGCEVFSLCWGTANLNNQIYFAGSGQDDVWSFIGSDPYTQGDWTQGCAGDIVACGANNQTPGAPNNATNQTYISQFNNGCMPITPVVAAAVVAADASCLCDGSATAAGSGSIPGYTYEWLDATYTPIGQSTATATGLCPGTYYAVVTSSIGCPDTAQVIIAATGTTTVTVNSVTICDGQSTILTATPNMGGGSYLWSPGGQTTASITVSPTATTVYTVDYTIAGCIATNTGTVTVNPIYNLTQSAVVCPNDSYTFPDGTTQVITANTTYTSNLTTVAGCDSIIVSTVTMNPIYNLTESATVCENDSYTFPDGTTQVITANTTYTSNLTTVAGCDSIIVSTVTMNPIYNLTQSAVVCPNDIYIFPDGTTQVITANTTYTSNLTTISGCDSIIVSTVTMNPIYNLTESAAVCQNDTYTFPDGTTQVITANTTYTSNLTTVAGCDSITVSTITMNPIYNLTESAAVCQNDSYTFPDGTSQVITANTTYTSNLTTVAGCDSIIVSTVTMNPIYASIDNVSLCTGSNFTFPNGTTHTNITAAESYLSTLTSIDGCDSLITTNITIDAVIAISVNQTICSGSNFTFADGTTQTNITANQSYTSSFISIFGCDSLYTQNIVVNPIYNATVNVTLCENSSYTYPDGFTEIISANTSHTSNLSTTAGCDSIIVTNVVMNPIYNLTEIATVCENDPYTFPDATTQVITANTTYTSNLTTVAGCDSIIVSTITMKPIYNLTESAVVCQNDSYIFPDGTTQVITANSTYTSNLTTATGCDSIIVSTVTMNPIYNLTESAAVCQNDSYTFPDGTSQVISANTTYTSNLTTAAGCDSIIVSTVTMNPIYNLTESAAVCQNDSYTFPDGTSQVITANTTYTSNLTTVAGCDSIIVSTITMNPIYNLTESAAVCQNDSYTFPDGTTQIITANTTYTSNLTTVAGCDSIIVSTITMNPIYNLTESAAVCQNDSYTFPDGTSQVISANTTYTSNLTTVAGCDSIIVSTITMNPIYNLTESAAVCQNDSYTYPDGTTQVITANTTYTSNLTTAAGCDSIIVSTITMNPIYNLTESAAVCENDSYTFPDGTTQVITANTTYTSNLTTVAGCDSIIVSTITMNPVYTTTQDIIVCYGDDYTFPDGTVHTNVVAPEDYTSYLQSVSGCDSIIITGIGIVTPSVNAGPDVTLCENESTLLTATGTVSYAWDNGVVNGVSFTPPGTTVYTVTGTDNNGCIATDDVLVTVVPLPMISVFADATEGCAPLLVNLSNPFDSDENCIWTFSNGVVMTGSEITVTFDQPGLIDLVITDVSGPGCANSMTYTNFIQVNAQPNANFFPTNTDITTLDNTTDLINTSTNADSYLWVFPDNSTSTVENPSYTFPEEGGGTYTITLYAFNGNGCMDSAFYVIQQIEELIFYVPNTFTPDQDEFNQIFQPIFTSGFDPYDFNMLIFNRWGEIVFETNDHTMGWDGTYVRNAQYNVQDGTYTWKIEFKTSSNDERQIHVGHVNVIR